MSDAPYTFRAALAAAVLILRSRRVQGALILACALTVAPFYFFIVRPPDDFPVGTPVEVSEGASLREIAASLENSRVVRSAFWLKNFVILLGGERNAQAGEYLFQKSAGVFSVAWTLARGRFGFDLLRVTIPEGTATGEIAALFSQRFPKFSGEAFARAADRAEGYLFPDTYFFPSNVTAPEVVSAMRKNFEEKYALVAEGARAFGKSKSEVVIMASLLEEEARTTESRRIIAGILWKRLDLGMPLQVDAVFPFILGKNTYQLSREDLAYDSPYNTYRYRGLPPGPITNPGLDALRTAVTPIVTPYLYYLSDHAGDMHYAQTFEEHVKNKERYLR